MKYLMKITPLEPYSFGNDQNFSYPDEKGTGKESYFVKSKTVPEQTTVFGLIRYMVLLENGLINSEYNYTAKEREQMKALVGGRSFSYLETKAQDFGEICEVSPVFLLNPAGEILVRNPYHNKAVKKGYVPMKMEAGVETSAGLISVPAAEEYNAKSGHATGYINLSTKEVETDLFTVQVQSGNRKNDRGETEDGCFFKREVIALKEGYSFAVYVDGPKLPQKAFGYMGKKKAAFLIETREVETIDLEAKVQDCFAEGDVWYYALSDIVLAKQITYKEYCIVEEKFQRNLETVYDAGSRLKKLRKSEIRHHLIQSGSVFYDEKNALIEEVAKQHENAKQIGYNRVVRLGGR